MGEFFFDPFEKSDLFAPVGFPFAMCFIHKEDGDICLVFFPQSVDFCHIIKGALDGTFRKLSDLAVPQILIHLVGKISTDDKGTFQTGLCVKCKSVFKVFPLFLSTVGVHVEGVRPHTVETAGLQQSVFPCPAGASVTGGVESAPGEIAAHQLEGMDLDINGQKRFSALSCDDHFT